MSSVAEIHRWRPSAVRDVAAAAAQRARVAQEVAHGLRALPALSEWDGQTASAARATAIRLQADLETQSHESRLVAAAAAEAAIGMTAVVGALHQLEGRAAAVGFVVDPISSRIVPGAGLAASPAQQLLVEADRLRLEADLMRVLAEATRVDTQFASAVAAATATAPPTEAPFQSFDTPLDVPSEPSAPTPQPGPKDPHDVYPDRSRDGTYGPGNSGDGKAAERAGLDAREQASGVQIIRDQVRATHPDATNPTTGKPQQRYYDGLEPTGNPDEYIGVEVKTNPGALQPDQQRFDDAVTVERPATAILDGREITIVDTETIYPPDGWQPPASGSPTAVAPSVPEVTPSAEPSITEKIDDAVDQWREGWGTQLTPQQMIDSGDPAMRITGQLIREQMAREGKIDTSGMA